MKLSVHAISDGRFIRAGEEAHQSLITPFLRKYAVVEESAVDDQAEEPAKRRFKLKRQGIGNAKQ
jgi:hypothetical protein